MASAVALPVRRRGERAQAAHRHHDAGRREGERPARHHHPDDPRQRQIAERQALALGQRPPRRVDSVPHQEGAEGQEDHGAADELDRGASARRQAPADEVDPNVRVAKIRVPEGEHHEPEEEHALELLQVGGGAEAKMPPDDQARAAGDHQRQRDAAEEHRGAGDDLIERVGEARGEVERAATFHAGLPLPFGETALESRRRSGAPQCSGSDCRKASAARMLKTTPFHSRTAALCRSHAWRRWAGYVVASSYELSHEREYHAIRNSAALLDISPLYKYVVRGKDAARLLDRVVTRDVARAQVDRKSD